MNGVPENGACAVFRTRRSAQGIAEESIEMSQNIVLAILLTALCGLVLRYWTRRLRPQTAGAGSQRMCPACGLITSRLKTRCLECGKLL
jgi:hypothetical protein